MSSKGEPEAYAASKRSYVCACVSVHLYLVDREYKRHTLRGIGGRQNTTTESELGRVTRESIPSATEHSNSFLSSFDVTETALE